MSQHPPRRPQGPDDIGGFIPAVVRVFLETRISLVFIIFSMCLGVFAILLTPREEEPQITVPLADVVVSAPGASAAEIEQLVATPLERLLWQIDGVEYVYSASRPDSAVVTVRFYVGEDREESLVKLHNTIMMHQDLVPPIVKNWLVRPVEIDDVPIVTLTLSSRRYDEFDLRRMGEELFARLTETPDLSKLTLTGGLAREIRVELDPERLSGMGLTPVEVADALTRADMSVRAGKFEALNQEFALTADSFLRSAREAGDLVVGVHQGRPVYLRDVAEVKDGPAEIASYTRRGLSDAQAARSGETPGDSTAAVTLALAKKKGTNAVSVADDILARVGHLEKAVLPDGVTVEVTRNYGETAQEKVTELIWSLCEALLTVVILLALTMGRREAMVVALSVPVSFALALFVNMLLGYTINRVTLFALILSLGLVVDDPIVNVDNIQRHILAGRLPPRRATLFAVREVLPPVIMSTLAIVVSFLPLYFISGMMGPYMAPMAANVPLAVGFSMIAALTVVPWLSYLLLRGKSPLPDLPEDAPLPEPAAAPSGPPSDPGLDEARALAPPAPDSGPALAASSGEDQAPTVRQEPVVEPAAAETHEDKAVTGRLGQLYRRVVSPFLDSRGRRLGLAATVVGLLLASLLLAGLGLVPLKMLPFDNKNEFQIVLDMPEGTTLETTDRAVRDLEAYLRGVPEVTNFVSYVGTASPMDFNALVRQYYLRGESNQADIRVNLLQKDARDMQSHAIVLRLRQDLEALAARHKARMRLVETPPGPPVVATVVAEVYGAPDMPYEALVESARGMGGLFRDEPGVTDVFDSTQARRDRINFFLDKEKAALHGVAAEDVTASLSLAMSGATPAMVHEPGERRPLLTRLVLPREKRSSISALERIPVKSDAGNIAPLAELGQFLPVLEDQAILHKNMRRVAYVFGETAGRAPAEAVFGLQARLASDPPRKGIEVDFAGEGEWKITVDVFRDLGLAFGAALVGIYILLIIETKSFSLPLLLMTAIPLTLLGILPGFWLLNGLFGKTVGGYADPVFFTATSMIGMIALGGIVIRNSLVLINFIDDSMRQGMELREAVLRSGAIRLRPIALTALTTMLGAWPITLDPIFSGLAWALIFGLLASTAFSLLLIPVAYYAVKAKAARTVVAA
ncbi:efflux RND transporter permease subunit [Desulfolutivibrio sulfoxidireducens]|uniref:efflux RND transporter permease subunit n=1 Tax=Desulfolutivibrio sulfoxidireducens TaxID=2773299 RepID=UPI00210E6D82|nr:efflux RND transporter permease subunit [Desulfolutivibrio sulfoxidireducens]